MGGDDKKNVSKTLQAVLKKYIIPMSFNGLADCLREAQREGCQEKHSQAKQGGEARIPRGEQLR